MDYTSTKHYTSSKGKYQDFASEYIIYGLKMLNTYPKKYIIKKI